MDDGLICLLNDVFEKEGALKFRLAKLDLADYQPISSTFSASNYCCPSKLLSSPSSSSTTSPLQILLSNIGKRLKEFRLDNQTFGLNSEGGTSCVKSVSNTCSVLLKSPPPPQPSLYVTTSNNTRY